jgi:hypothetical protein
MIVFGSGSTLNAEYTEVGGQAVSMKPTLRRDLP